MPPRRPPIILDIEASGFGPVSYPIEIGVILDDGRKYCSLVQPRSDWTHWDPHAEAMHGISRDTLLAHGRPAIEVAGTLNELLRGRTAYTDGWVVDRPWLDRLYEAAAIHCEFTLSALEMILSEEQMLHWSAVKQRLLDDQRAQRHRASYDAAVIQQTFERTRAPTRS
jgi:hypothetical protein